MKSRTSRKSRSALRGQLLAYSAAAGAAIALPATAGAQAITNITVDKFTGSLSASQTGSEGAGFHADTGSFHVGVAGVSLRIKKSVGANSTSFIASALGTGGMVFKGGNGRVDNVGTGAGIADLHAPGGVLANAVLSYGNFAGVYGAFAVGVNGLSRSGYIAFNVGGAGGTYGWVGVAVHRSNDIIDQVKFVDQNHDGIYGAFGPRGISVGQVGATAPVPEPASAAAGLGLFALGAAGIREYRRRKQQAA